MRVTLPADAENCENALLAATMTHSVPGNQDYLVN
jgi:hypothetical protein